ncbi:MAG: nucleotidyltransferase domain-containing protein [Clostridia bacterium]|nr:nucleotidyltransferase domain-containing protein [Clostridia bacterium]
MVYTIEQIRRIASPIAASYGVKSLSLFGSYARGEATEDSDIDLLLDRSGMSGGWAIGGLYSDLSEALGKELDMVTTTGADRSFLARIQRDEVRLYER